MSLPGSGRVPLCGLSTAILLALSAQLRSMGLSLQLCLVPKPQPSKDHSISRLRRDLWSSPSPAPLPRQVAQELIQVRLECLC